jgi:hypothetical protein
VAEDAEAAKKKNKKKKKKKVKVMVEVEGPDGTTMVEDDISQEVLNLIGTGLAY